MKTNGDIASGKGNMGFPYEIKNPRASKKIKFYRRFLNEHVDKDLSLFRMINSG